MACKPDTKILFFWYTELEALEACYWLKAAGFPQYAQAYEGNTIWQFQIRISLDLWQSVTCTFQLCNLELENTLKMAQYHFPLSPT